MTKLVLLDVDDTFLSPPYKAVSRVLHFYHKLDVPSELEMSERSHIDYHSAFPRIFKSKNQMWLRVLQSLPFGFFRSHKLLPGVDRDQLALILADPRVYLVSKNPPIFSRWRIKRIAELTGVNVANRYLACGPIFRKSTPKIQIFRAIAKLHGISPDEALVIDDDPEVIEAADHDHFNTRLIDTPWNKTNLQKNRMTRENLCSEVISLLGEMKKCPRRGKERVVFPYQRLFSPFTDSLRLRVNSLKTGVRLKKVDYIESSLLWSFINIFRPQKKAADIEGSSSFSADQIRRDGLIMWTNLGFAVPYSIQTKNESDLGLDAAYAFPQQCRDRAASFYRTLGYSFKKDFLLSTTTYKKADLVKSIRDECLGADTQDESLNQPSTSKFNEYAREMISSRHLIGSAIVYRYVSILTGLIFRRVKVKCHSDLKMIESKYYTVYVGLHRSVFDSAVLMKFMGDHSHQLPFVPAADKMRTNIVGWIGAIIGTFYIRRKKVDLLYNAIMQKLIQFIFQSKTPLGIFLEGQRSRSGLTLPPKGGIFKLIAREFDDAPNVPIAVVPLSFSYNKLPESEVLLDEVYMEHKKIGVLDARSDSEFIIRKKKLSKSLPKKIFALIKFLASPRVSEVYITAGNPIILREAGAREKVSVKADMDGILHKIMCEGNATVPPLATSVACLGILTAKDQHIYATDLVSFMNFSSLLLRLLSKNYYQGLVFDAEFDFIEELNNLPFINSKFKSNKIDNQDIISLTDLDKMRATHYRNNILHYFIVPSWIAYLINSCKQGSIFDILKHINSEASDLSNKFFIHPENFSQPYLEKIFSLYSMAKYIELVDGIYYLRENSQSSPFSLFARLGYILHHQYSMKMIDFARRLNRRYAYDFRCTMSSTDSSPGGGIGVEQNLKNVSMTGGYVAEKCRWADKDSILVQLSAGNLNIEVPGRIVRLEAQGFAFRFIYKEALAHDKVKNLIFLVSENQEGTMRA